MITPDPGTSIARIRDWIAHLSSIERPSAGDGERVAAEWIVDELRALGVLGRVEADPVHGTHWLPLGLPNLLAAGASALPSRSLRGLLALTAVASVVDDLESRGQRLRRLLPKRHTYHVVAELGERDTPRTIVFVAHHDVARAFHPAFARMTSAPPPRWMGHREPPIVALLAYGPALVLAAALTGSRSLRIAGAALSTLAYTIETDIGRREPVPGANDNASGVACILELARDLRERPADDVRVVLVSTGAEETLLEGMQTYWTRHGVHLDPASTLVVCVDTIGWKHLVLRDGEGILRLHRSPEALLRSVAGIAAAAGVELLRRPAFGVPTDGLVARRAGVPTILLTSVAADGGAPHYHQASDVLQNVDLSTVADGARLCRALIDAS